MTGTTSSSVQLSALVVVHDEEAQLAECLDTVRFADEIVVVLDDCTDRSKEIASAYTSYLFEGSWDIEGERRNFGIGKCCGDWILEVDADERVPEALAREIRETIQGAARGYFLIPYDNYIGKRLVRFGWGAYWGVSATVRLFSKGAKSWGGQRIHPSLELTGVRGRLGTPMVHYVDRDISDMIARLDRYTTARARDLRDLGDIGSFTANLRRIFSRFFKCFIIRKGYREGIYGFLIAMFAGLYPMLSYLKARLHED